MSVPPEVLIYIQSIKNYFNNNIEAKNYFIINGDEEFFYHHLIEISKKNLEKDGEPMLSMEQFELLRKTMMIISIINKPNEENEEDKLFIDLKEFGKFCLN
jgi:hypothetical protein